MRYTSSTCNRLGTLLRWLFYLAVPLTLFLFAERLTLYRAAIGRGSADEDLLLGNETDVIYA